MSNETDAGDEHSYKRDVAAVGVTTFQLLPDNGGWVIVFGSRRLEVRDDTFDTFPVKKQDPVAAVLISTNLFKDLHRVMGLAISDYEKLWGNIPIPGVDTPND